MLKFGFSDKFRSLKQSHAIELSRGKICKCSHSGKKRPWLSKAPEGSVLNVNELLDVNLNSKLKGGHQGIPESLPPSENLSGLKSIPEKFASLSHSSIGPEAQLCLGIREFPLSLLVKLFKFSLQIGCLCLLHVHPTSDRRLEKPEPLLQQIRPLPLNPQAWP